MYDFDSLFLNGPLSATSDADPDDVLSAKSALNRLGYYETPSYGLTPYPDQPLFDGIRSYQKDKGLTVDGYMQPGGETEHSVNFSLATTRRDDENAADDGCADPAIFPFPDFPGRRNYCPLPRENPNEEDCERQREDDQNKCRKIKEQYGSYRAQRCWASSNLRYSNCLRGKLNFPPLDRGYP